MSDCYTFDEKKIVYEALSHEVVLVNLDNGHYYILEGTAALLWQWISASVAVPEVVRAFQTAYTGEGIERAVTDLVAEWLAEELLAASEVSAEPATRPELMRLLPTTKSPFTAPAMFKYTDMANLIQMDPIREFDETGWPKRRRKPDGKE